MSSFVGCALVTSLDDLRGAGSDASSGGDANSGSDANSGGDASSDDAGVPNLVDNSSFENGAGGCGAAWGAGYNATYAQTSPGHSGNQACLVCLQEGATDSYELDSLVPIPVQSGTYYASAFLMTPGDAAAVSAGIQIYFTGDGGISNCVGDSTYCQGSMTDAPTGSWGSTSATFQVTGSGELKVDLHAYGAPVGSCFEVDDVSLTAQ
jgi:hypothetical protein